MKESQFELLEKCLFDIQERDEKLNKKDTDIATLLEEQNKRFELLKKGYPILPWPCKNEDECDRWVSREIYHKELESIEMYNDVIKNNPGTEDALQTSVELTRSYISDMLTVTGNRWDTICNYRVKLRTNRAALVEEELELYETFQNLISQKDQTEPTAWHKQADLIPDQHIILIVSQEKIISEEEDLQQELDSILALREKILKIATELR
ncbi:MAG: hypothetical protein WCL06_04545 [Bacteroidota bacterium]